MNASDDPSTSEQPATTGEQAPFERRDSPRVHVAAKVIRNGGGEGNLLEVKGLLSFNGYFFESDTPGWAGEKVSATLDMGSAQLLELDGKLTCPNPEFPSHYLFLIEDLDFDIERVLARYIDTESKADQLPVDE